MRSITARITAIEGSFGPFHRGVVETEGIDLRALHELRLLNDGSTVMLYEYSGSREKAEALAKEYFGQGDSEWQTGRINDNELMYAHAEPSELVKALLWAIREYRIVVDWPITFHSDAEIEVTLIGDDGQLQRAVSDDIEGVSIRIERTGDYLPELERLASGLTEREYRTLKSAVELGYYQNPREANYRDIAQELDCSTGTVGAHLRNAESKVMQGVIVEGGSPHDRSNSVAPL